MKKNNVGSSFVGTFTYLTLFICSGILFFTGCGPSPSSDTSTDFTIHNSKTMDAYGFLKEIKSHEGSSNFDFIFKDNVSLRLQPHYYLCQKIRSRINEYDGHLVTIRFNPDTKEAIELSRGWLRKPEGNDTEDEIKVLTKAHARRLEEIQNEHAAAKASMEKEYLETMATAEKKLNEARADLIKAQEYERDTVQQIQLIKTKNVKEHGELFNETTMQGTIDIQGMVESTTSEHDSKYIFVDIGGYSLRLYNPDYIPIKRGAECRISYILDRVEGDRYSGSYARPRLFSVYVLPKNDGPTVQVAKDN